MADEGYLLLQALDLANGKVLYRDMDAFVTPGMWFLLALVFEIVEPSVWASRIPVVLAYVGLIALAYRIPAAVCGPRAGLASVACMLVATVWAFPAWTFAFYSPFSVLFALAALERMLVVRERILADSHGFPGARRALLQMGLWLGCSILFKQNYGVFALVAAVLSLVVVRVEARLPTEGVLLPAARDTAWLVIAMTAVGLPPVLYLLLTGAFDEAFYSLVIHPFEFSGRHGIPYLAFASLFEPLVMSETIEIMTYGAQPLYRAPMPTSFVADTRVIERMHVLLYWMPPLILILGATLALTGRDPKVQSTSETGALVHGGLAIVLLFAGFVFLGTFPRADFNHLINVYQPVVIATVVVFATWLDRLRDRVFVRGLVALVLAATGLAFAAIAGWWYYALVQTMTVEVEGPRGGVKISPPEAVSLRTVMRNIERLSPPGEALLTVPDIAMLNFLSGRPMPSPYYNLYEHHIAHDGGAAVVEGAEESGATLAVTRLNDFFSDLRGLRDYAPVLTAYLDTHFEQEYTVGRAEYLVYTKRAEPLPAETFDSVLEDCTDGVGFSEIEDHLLFRTLYQTTGPGGLRPSDIVATRCRVTVPRSGARLVWRLDYPLPVRRTADARLKVEVVAVDGGSAKPVFSHSMEIQTTREGRLRIPAPPEYEVDLGEYAGRSIEVVMRSTRSGRVVMSNMAWRGFGTRWQDPRIVAD